MSRFISENPIGFAGGDVNLYAYVGGNPISLVDPLGLMIWSDGGNGWTDTPTGPGWTPWDGGSPNLSSCGKSGNFKFGKGGKPPRWTPMAPGEGKPKYTINGQHVLGPKYNPNKTLLPPDAGSVYKQAVPDDPYNPRHWWGRNEQGQFYRYHSSNDGTAHYSGTFDRKDSSIPPYVRPRFGY